MDPSIRSELNGLESQVDRLYDSIETLNDEISVLEQQIHKLNVFQNQLTTTFLIYVKLTAHMVYRKDGNAIEILNNTLADLKKETEKH